MDHGIAPARLDDFKSLWTEVFDEELESVEAVVIATRLVGFYRLITRPLPPEVSPPAPPPAPAARGTS